MMEQLRRPRVLVAVVAVIVVIAAVTLLFRGTDAADSSASISAKVKSGEFRVIVATAGELRARKGVQIQGPPTMQPAQVYQTRISYRLRRLTLYDVKAARPLAPNLT